MIKTNSSLPSASLLLIGDELTTGAVNDTNGKYLAEKLTELGFEITGLEIVRDRIEEIVAALKRAAASSKLIVTTGGLGPTTDDLTRDALADLLGVELFENEPSLRKIEERYQQRGIPMNPISRRQALFPMGSTIVNNSAGTADSFWVQEPETATLIFSFPGVPGEMKIIFDEELVPLLYSRFPVIQKPNAAYLRCFGLSESAIGSAIESAHLGAQFTIGYRPVFPEVWVKFAGEGVSEGECLAAREAAAEAIGREHIVSHSYDISLAKTVLELLKERRLTVSFAESCTGGLASSNLVSESGASDVFLGSIVCYANAVKEREVGVRRETLEQYGAVSAETALELAEGVRRKLQCDIGVSITGIAGPTGGSDAKPAGTVFLGYSTAQKTEVVRHLIQFERNRFRGFVSHLALDLIRRDLMGYSLQFSRR